jgi:DNA uptake protein ComE-like DNA-binding protein
VAGPELRRACEPEYGHGARAVDGTGIKAASVTDLLKKRPFFTKEEIVKRVTGIGKKTYELLEEKICVR